MLNIGILLATINISLTLIKDTLEGVVNVNRILAEEKGLWGKD